ncbi:neurogenic locus notch protein [Lasius niger]|uniref:Neurogenic locus notch protein n=1 Tax=Lasius niger TaxID=67767 RepID=A0A0J7MT12_LASNI|nr:neurogenic locus notch protein [Lasius niger]
MIFAAVPQDPCNPSPCGANAMCRDGTCTCLPEYHGDPYTACRPECVQNPDCPLDKACVRNKCFDPCTGVCGQNAKCTVINHTPMCACPDGMSGNAFAACYPVVQGKPIDNRANIFMR